MTNHTTEPVRQFVSLTDIKLDPSRQRKKFDAEKARNLESSILERGLLQPIGVETRADGLYLIYGERRLRAFKALNVLEHSVMHGTDPIPPGMIPAIVFEILTPQVRKEIELAENVEREDLTWQERVEALAEIAALYPDKPKEEFYADIAPRLGHTPTYTKQIMLDALKVKQNMDVAAVKGARSLVEAVAAASKHQENNLMAEIIRRSQVQNKHKASELIEMRQGDLLKVMPQLDEGLFDMILADPPYGLDAGAAFGQKVEAKHNYRDDEKYAKEIATTLLVEGFRVCKPRAHIFIFCKPLLFSFLHELATRMLWTPFNSPIVWRKGPGYAPWGNLGFRRNGEFLFWAVKGQRGLNYLVEDIIDIPNIRNKEHGAAKPLELMEVLIKAATMPGDYILDPCMGSGSSMIAARQCQRKGLGLEFSSEYFNLAINRLDTEQNNAAS